MPSYEAAIKEYYDLYHLSNRLYAQFAKRHGETASTLFTLFALHENPEGISLKAVQELIMVPKQTLSSLLDTLAKRGLVDRRESPADKRSKLFFLTEAGKHYCNNVFAELNTIETNSLHQMELADFERMNASLKQFLALFEREMDERK